MPATLALAVALLLGRQEPASAPEPDAAPAPPSDAFRPDPSWRPLGEDLWFDPASRSLILRARVVLREGFLEHLLCREHTKEHESVLATKAPPKMIHAGLILAVGEPGHPVRYRPEFEPPAGPPVAIEAEWVQDGRRRRVDARKFVKNERQGRPLETHWVFAGSYTLDDPESNRVLYGAEGGDLITVANFPTAILDLPIASSNTNDELGYVAAPDQIPPLETPVTLYLHKPEPATKSEPAAKSP